MMNMFGGGPEPLPEWKAQDQFAKQMRNFALFTVAVSAVALFTRHIERRAYDALH